MRPTARNYCAPFVRHRDFFSQNSLFEGPICPPSEIFIKNFRTNFFLLPCKSLRSPPQQGSRYATDSISPFQTLIYLLFLHLYLVPLILSTPGSLLIDCLLIPTKLNTSLLEPNRSVQKLQILQVLSMVLHLSQFLLLAT